QGGRGDRLGEVARDVDETDRHSGAVRGDAMPVGARPDKAELGDEQGNGPPGDPPGDPPSGPPDRGPHDLPTVDYWGRVKEFDRLWERHVERWPRAPEDGERDTRRPGDPPGSWRGEGGRYLTPQQNSEADRLIAALRAPEKEITALMQAIERDNTH